MRICCTQTRQRTRRRGIAYEYRCVAAMKPIDGGREASPLSGQSKQYHGRCFENFHESTEFPVAVTGRKPAFEHHFIRSRTEIRNPRRKRRDGVKIGVSLGSAKMGNGQPKFAALR